MSDQEVRQVIIRMEPAQHDSVKERAELLGWSMAEWVRQAIDHFASCDDGDASARRDLVRRLA